MVFLNEYSRCQYIQVCIPEIHSWSNIISFFFMSAEHINISLYVSSKLDHQAYLWSWLKSRFLFDAGGNVWWRFHVQPQLQWFYRRGRLRHWSSCQEIQSLQPTNRKININKHTHYRAVNIMVPCTAELLHCAGIFIYFMALLVKINWEGMLIHYFFCGWVGVSKYYLGGMEWEFLIFFCGWDF